MNGAPRPLPVPSHIHFVLMGERKIEPRYLPRTVSIQGQDQSMRIYPASELDEHWFCDQDALTHYQRLSLSGLPPSPAHLLV